MAVVNNWHAFLNECSFCKKLRENNAKDSRKKLQGEAKGIITIQDNELYVWDSLCSHLLHYNLKNILQVPEERHQILQCNDVPKFDVSWLVWNQTGSHLALWGQLGIMVMELPQKWGRYSEYEGGKEVVTCKSVSVAEHHFASHCGVKLLQVSWHPGSLDGMHLAFLTSDNTLCVYSLREPDSPVQVISLGEEERSISMSYSRQFAVLTDNAVSFDFGTEVKVHLKNQGYLETPKSQGSVTLWPVYCLRGNGDVVVVYTDLESKRPIQLGIQGPLLMHPPAEDNYGNDACSILYLQTSPPVITIATCEGKLHHCIVLARGVEDTSIHSVSSWKSSTRSVNYNIPEEMSLFVHESVELELSLTTPVASMDVFTCPIKLLKDSASPDRYHCCHAAGVHTVVLPWIQQYETFCSEDRTDAPPTTYQESIVEHLVCTKPLQSSAQMPILGLGVVRDHTLGSVLLTLTSDYEFIGLHLSGTKYRSSTPPLVSSSPPKLYPSPIRKLIKEPFEERIRKILQRTTSNPLLRSQQTAQITQQACFELLSRATQVFREQYIQKQDLARQEISTRVGILSEQKKQQLEDLQKLQRSRVMVSNMAEQLGDKCQECKEKQEEMLSRIQVLMRKLQSRIPFLSDAERTMKRELESMEERLESYKRNLDQLKTKEEYQQRQISKQTSQQSPVIKSSHMGHLHDALKEQGDELQKIMKKMKEIKMDATV
ncbi:hypothetical protein ACJMK2_011523 [Sinanodonta woodiana]|uniref:Nuclear pore complex protein Nup88 n=1 Tax=Sinanodonta woodiana TaxID=1069815 RepID=A0ABD3V5A1_SINWO